MTTREGAPTRVGVIGLGIIGTAFAVNLLEDGLEVVGYDIEGSRIEELVRAGGSAAESPLAVADAADVVLIAVASLGVLPAIAEELTGVADPAPVVADVGTLPLAEKEQARRSLAGAGIDLLDCTISGTGAQAVARDIVFMASGGEAAKTAIRPVLEHLGKAVYDVGEFGNGIKIKFIANLLVAVHNAATAEALLLAERAGLDLQQVLEVLAPGAGSSRMFEVRGPMIADRSYDQPTARVSMFMKDMALIKAFAEEVDAPTPLLDTTRDLYNQAMEQGLGAYDAAAVHAVLEGLDAT